MQVEICRWGKSLAVRIPASVLAAARVAEGTRLDVTVGDTGAIAMVPVRRRLTLQQLMDQVTPANLHGET